MDMVLMEISRVSSVLECFQTLTLKASLRHIYFQLPIRTRERVEGLKISTRKNPLSV